MKSRGSIKLAIVISHPIQYWVPVYRALDAFVDLEVKVFFVAENGAHGYFDAEFQRQIKWDIPLTDGYPHEFLERGKILGSYDFSSVDSPRINRKLDEFEPDYVWLHGYAQRINWRVWWRKISPFTRSIRLIYTSDSNTQDPRNWLRSIGKISLVKLFFAGVDHFISCGPNNRRYLEIFGAESECITESTLPVDTARFQAQLDATAQLLFAKQLGIKSEQTVLLYAGKLAKHKRPQDAIELIADLRSAGHDVLLLMIGSGALCDDLKNRVKELDIEDAIIFIGFVNQSQLPNYLGLSDILIFPSSREPYGLIASEVLSFGLAIVAAHNIGAVGASIVDGGNALLYPCGDIAALSTQVRRLLDDPSLLKRFGGFSRKIAKNHDKQVLADAIYSICKRENIKN